MVGLIQTQQLESWLYMEGSFCRPRSAGWRHMLRSMPYPRRLTERYSERPALRNAQRPPPTRATRTNMMSTRANSTMVPQHRHTGTPAPLPLSQFLLVENSIDSPNKRIPGQWPSPVKSAVAPPALRSATRNELPAGQVGGICGGGAWGPWSLSPHGIVGVGRYGVNSSYRALFPSLQQAQKSVYKDLACPNNVAHANASPSRIELEYHVSGHDR